MNLRFLTKNINNPLLKLGKFDREIFNQYYNVSTSERHLREGVKILFFHERLYLQRDRERDRERERERQERKLMN